MWNDKYEYQDSLDLKDCLYGCVTSRCKKGVFLTLENGEDAFAYFGGLNPGDRALCTVLKKPTERWRALVTIDSVEKELMPSA